MSSNGGDLSGAHIKPTRPGLDPGPPVGPGTREAPDQVRGEVWWLADGGHEPVAGIPAPARVNQESRVFQGCGV